MTPKEKAKELVDKFSNECLLTIDGAKVAALIAVDEVLSTMDEEDNYVMYKYWQQVKQEIENFNLIKGSSNSTTSYK